MPATYYFADDAPWLPYANSFNANVWDSDTTRRPVGDQRRRSQEHGNDWYDGHPPPPGCCNQPFGTPQAWKFGGEGQPTKMSCVWNPQTITFIRLALKLISKVISPRRYRGLIRLSLKLLSTVVTPRRYRGLISLALTPHSTVVSPRRYSAHLALSLTPRSSTRSAPFYRGLIPLALKPASSYHKVGPYQGRIALRLTLASRPFPGHFYRGLIPLALTPNSPHWLASYYRGLLALGLKPSSSYFEGISGCWTNPVPATLQLTCAGVGTGSSCTGYNGTHTLNYGSGCQWNDPTDNPQGAPWWVLRASGSGVVLFGQSTLGNFRAEYSLSTWDGSLPVTLPLTSTLSCTGWPSSITVTG